MALVGMRANEVTIPLVDIVSQEIELIGVSTYANRFPTALEYLASGI